MTLSRSGRFPCQRSHSTSQSGTVATSTELSPEETRWLAQETAPLPMKSRSAPTTAEAFHCANVGFLAPRKRHHTYNNVPADRKRIAPIPNGGIVSTPQ